MKDDALADINRRIERPHLRASREYGSSEKEHRQTKSALQHDAVDTRASLRASIVRVFGDEIDGAKSLAPHSTSAVVHSRRIASCAVDADRRHAASVATGELAAISERERYGGDHPTFARGDSRAGRN